MDKNGPSNDRRKRASIKSNFDGPRRSNLSSTLGAGEARLGDHNAATIQEASRELESPMKSRRSKNSSVMSNESKNSRADQMNDMLGYLEDVK